MMQSRQLGDRFQRLACLAAAFCAHAVLAQSVSFTQSQLLDRYAGMWLGESIANWTGLRTEGRRIDPPFLTDADWGLVLGPAPLDFEFQTPWGSDDDTDIEYVYLHAMARTGSTWLSPQAIRDAWRKHVNSFIWVSNFNARALMERGVVSPATGMSAANHHRLAIDAQLTTEMFGALCPGDPTLALELSYLPIRTTSVGHASHASQFYAVLYALAPLVDQQLSGRDQAIWLVTTARDYLPTTSKARSVINTVLNDFLANPDVNDWERTRDIVYERYHQHASQYGYTYFGWTESSVNLATGVMALLYGQGDFRRTVQIGTLSGWDSDNGTATMGGLLGLMHGAAWVRAQFPERTLSDAYWISRTRDALPDYTPNDPTAEDTFTMMAQRMVDLARANVLACGGVIDGSAQDPVWTLAPTATPSSLRLFANPAHRETLASATRYVRSQGWGVTTTSSVVSNPPAGRGSSTIAVIADGRESNQQGVDETWFQDPFYTTQRPTPPATATLRVEHSFPVEVSAIRFIEGDRFSDATSNGGYFIDPVLRVRIGSTWTPIAAVAVQAFDPLSPFQVLTYRLPAPITITGIEISGTQGGVNQFVTCAEFDALRAVVPAEAGGPRCTGLDVTQDRQLDLSDLYAWHEAGGDVNVDGLSDERDYAMLVGILRSGERKSMLR